MAETNITAQRDAGDLSRVENKLQEVCLSLLAMKNIAAAYETGGIDGETLSASVDCISKQAIRSLDACIVKLGGIPSGVILDELEEVMEIAA